MLAWLFLFIQLVFALFFFYLVLAFYTGAPFVPSTHTTAAAMIRHAHIKKGMRVYDLGSGNGKLLFLAAKRGALATGYEINPFLVLLTNVKALFSPHRNRIHAIWKNFWQADLSKADVILLYLVPWKMDRLEKKLLREVRPGTRIICNSFLFDHLPCIEKDTDNHVYVFTIPKKHV